MNNKRRYIAIFLVLPILIVAVFASCRQTHSERNLTGHPAISEDSLLTLLQYESFQYFWDGAEPNSGMARERIHLDNIYPQNDQNVVTTGGAGFGL